MHWYDYMVWIAVFGQMLFLYQAVRHYHYAVTKARRKRGVVAKPSVALVIPCKGLDNDFHANISSFLGLDYDNYSVLLVVADPSDPAYKELRALVDQRDRTAKAPPVRILVSGPCTSCSQKIHNLLYAVEHVPHDTEILAFADSDARVHSDWLARLIWPLRHCECGVTTGYRWFVPTQNNLATLALSALNAGVAQLLGNSRFNRAWGGSMAMRLDDFRRLGLPEIWRKTLSDDLSVSRAVKEAGMKVAFVPSCLVASHEGTTWSRLFEFCRRQFLITRVYSPTAWWLGFISSLGSVAGLWGLVTLAICTWRSGAENSFVYAAAAVVFFVGQLLRAVLRQATAFRLLPEHVSSLKTAAVADVLGCWLWSPLLLVLMLSSAFGRTITWRGIRYRLVSPSETHVLSDIRQMRGFLKGIDTGVSREKDRL